jgi:dGTPase
MGAAAISGLMEYFWSAIHNRTNSKDFFSRRTSPTDKYAASKISPNYLEEANRCEFPHDVSGSVRYRELRLLTDMISGMTDTFAVKLYEDLRQVGLKP